LALSQGRLTMPTEDHVFVIFRCEASDIVTSTRRQGDEDSERDWQDREAEESGETAGGSDPGGREADDQSSHRSDPQILHTDHRREVGHNDDLITGFICRPLLYMTVGLGT
jgi:hypothetical protein